MKIKFIFIFMLGAILILSACSAPSKTAESFSQSSDKNAIILNNRFDSTLVDYNLQTNSVLNNLYPLGEVYNFSNDKSLYTVGSSTEYHFSVISVEEKSIKTLIKIDGNKGIFPLAKAGNAVFFLETTYDKHGNQININVVRMIGSKLENYANIVGDVQDGVIINDLLYYSVYVERTDKYDIYSVKYADEKAMPTLYQSNLSNAELYTDGAELFWKQGSQLVTNENPNLKISSSSENIFLSKKYLLQYSINSASELEATLTNLVSMKKETVMKNIVDFSLNGNLLTLYGDGSKKVLILE